HAAVEAEAVDAGLECAPAPEAIILGYGTLRLGEPRRGIAPAQLGQPLLCGLLQPVDVGLGGKRLGHGTPSFRAPGVRGSRARKKEMSHVELQAGSTLHADRRSSARPQES